MGAAAREPGLSGAVAVGAATLLALSLLAFWPRYLSRPAAAVDGYTHLHAMLGTAWVVMLIAQALLVRAGRLAPHRVLGRVSYIVAPAFALSGLLLAHDRFSRMAAATFEQEAYSLYLPLSAMVLFASAYALAMRYRRRYRLHARLMACTALLLVDPVAGRVLGFYLPELPALWQYQAITFGAECVLAVALLRSLPPQSQDRRHFGWFVAVFVLVLGLWFVLPYTAGWLTFATWFRGLPLT